MRSTQFGAAAVAALLGDRTRFMLLEEMLGGDARAVSALARAADVSVPAASEALTRMEAAGLVISEWAGREHRYSLAGPNVAEALEALAVLGGEERPRGFRAVTKMETLREGRTCYDHLAGRLGVAVADAAVSAGALDDMWQFTPRAERWFAEFGVKLGDLAAPRRPLLRVCIDWTEKREHLAGQLGAAICSAFFERGWVARVGSGRAVTVTALGRERLAGLGVLLHVATR